MELHKTLRNIVLIDGQGFLKEVRPVNILDDFNACQDKLASEYIFRAFIADGYATKMLTVDKWDNTVEKRVVNLLPL